jgi:hypothetical protein
MLLLLALTCFSWRSYIFMMFGEQRHLVRHFWINICPSCRIFKFGCTFLICWCIVSVWPVVGQYVLCTGEKFSSEYSGFQFFVLDGWIFPWYRINLLSHFFFSLVSAALSYADVIAYIKSDDWVVCLWCRTGCLFLSHFLTVLPSPCWFDRDFLVIWICFRVVNRIL